MRVRLSKQSRRAHPTRAHTHPQLLLQHALPLRQQLQLLRLVLVALLQAVQLRKQRRILRGASRARVSGVLTRRVCADSGGGQRQRLGRASFWAARSSGDGSSLRIRNMLRGAHPQAGLRPIRYRRYRTPEGER